MELDRIDGLVEWLSAQLNEDERWALEASRLQYGGEVVATGVHWHWECGDGDEELAPDPMLDEFLECPTHESVSVALRSRERYETSHVGRLSQHAMPTVEEVAPAVAGHVARHDPARVLRQVAAHRAILHELDAMPHALDDGHHECPMVDPGMWRDPRCTCGTDPFVDRMRRHLATVYADREGWREEWRPG